MNEVPRKQGVNRRDFLKISGIAGAFAILGNGLKNSAGSSVLAAINAANSSDQNNGEWHYSYCRMCMRGDCAIKYRLQDGVVMEVKGNTDSPVNQGAMCSRGLSLIQNLYNPYRVKSPLKRTNPKKGFDEDPGWVEISWEEALDTVAEKFKAIHDKDPRGLLVNLGFGGMDFFTSFIPYIPAVFGTPNQITSNGPLCSVHYATELVQASMPTANADYQHCNYHISIGRTTGGNIGAANGEVRFVADAIARGMKLVVVDPRCSPEASKGQWVPIIPGGDLAFVLGLIHTVLFEIQKVDEHFLTTRTNGPYLINSDGSYFRSENGKPQVIDVESGEIVEFDDSSLAKPKLEATIDTDQGEMRTSFSIIKAKMKDYTPEWAEEKSTVPAATIRQIANDFVEHAQIGATININGTVLPYRPVSIIGERGSMNHQDGTVLDLATKVLNELVGAMDVPGGCLGCNRGPVLHPDADGTVAPHGEAVGVPFSYPPQTVDLSEYYPYRHSMPYLAYPVAMEPEKYGLEYNIEGALIVGGNSVIGVVEPEKMAEAMASIPFVTTIAYDHDEVVALSDIVLPEHAMLERRVVNVYETTFGGFGPETFGLQMPMYRDPVPANYNTRPSQDIILDLFERIGLLPGIYGMMNAAGVLLGESTMVPLPDHLKFDPSQKYSYQEILDRALQALAGDGKDTEWFAKNGLWKRQVPLEQCFNYYYFPEGETRYQIYFEKLRSGGETLRENLETNNVTLPDNVDFDKMFAFFDPVPQWRSTALMEGPADYDLRAINFKITNANFRLGGQDQMPWLNEVSDTFDPYFNVICVNPQTAAKQGLEDGQVVWVESQYGKIEGKIKTSQLFHPSVVGIAGALGRMVDTVGKLPPQRLHYNRLLGAPLDTIDPIAGGVENTVRVKVYAA